MLDLEKPIHRHPIFVSLRVTIHLAYRYHYSTSTTFIRIRQETIYSIHQSAKDYLKGSCIFDSADGLSIVALGYVRYMLFPKYVGNDMRLLGFTDAEI